MAFVPAPNITMIEWRMVLNGQKVENRLMLHSPTQATPAALQAFAIFGWNWWENTYAPLITHNCLLSSVVATDLTVQNSAQYTYAPDTTTTGTVAGAGMPNEVAFCLSLHTDVRGRSARGRWFVAGIPRESMADDNNLSSTAAEALRAALGTYVSEFQTGTTNIMIVSYRSGGVPRPGGPVYFIVRSVSVTDTIVDSQKRRKPGVGT